MKLSSVVAKLTGGKVKVLGALGGLVLAGAAMTVATPAAKAQVAFGVAIGGPRYYAPRPVYRPYVAGPVYGPGYGYGYGYAAPYYGYPHYEGWRGRGYWGPSRPAV